MFFADTFRQAMAECAAAQDELMGEIVTVAQYAGRPNFPTAPTGVAPANVVAIFTWASETAFSGADSKRLSASRDVEIMAPLVTTRKPRFSFKTCVLPWPILRAYRITRCVDGSTWDVTSVKPDGAARIEVAVVELGRSTQ